jgi:protein SCO1/2
MRKRLGAIAALMLGASSSPVEPRDAAPPTIGPAPPFALVSQDGKPVSLGDFHGKVLAVAFMYTSCPDICPLLTQKMAQVQDALGADFGARIAFVSITVDPEHDTPGALKKFATAFGANFAGWAFLTGPPAVVRGVIDDYGVAAIKNPEGGVDHAALTSLIDRHGMLRVQYAGTRWQAQEFLHDLETLAVEP